MHAHTHLTTVILVYYANNNFMGLFYYLGPFTYVLLLDIIGKNQYLLWASDVTPSLICWFPPWQFKFFNLQLLSCLLFDWHEICIKQFCFRNTFSYGLTVSDPFPLNSVGLPQSNVSKRCRGNGSLSWVYTVCQQLMLLSVRKLRIITILPDS